MNGLPYYKAFPRDFIEGTIGMPGEMKCAYRLLLDLIYIQGGDLPDDPHYIGGNLGYSTRKWRKIRQFLIDAGKIEIKGEFITNPRVALEVEKTAKYQRAQSQNASSDRNKNKGEEKPKAPKPKTPKPDPQLDRFDEFWDLVPRKVAKGAARRKWDVAIKKTSPETIIAGMRRYAAEMASEPDRFVAHPSTWLHGERWSDQPKPVNQKPERGQPNDSTRFDAAHREYARRVGAGEIDAGPDPSDPFGGG